MMDTQTSGQITYSQPTGQQRYIIIIKPFKHNNKIDEVLYFYITANQYMHLMFAPGQLLHQLQQFTVFLISCTGSIGLLKIVCFLNVDMQ